MLHINSSGLANWQARYPILLKETLRTAELLFEPFIRDGETVVLYVIPENDLSENPEGKSLMVNYQYSPGLPNEFTVFLKEVDTR